MKTRNKSLPEYQFGPFQVLVQSPISEDVDISTVFNEVINLLPEHFLRLIDVVYIGEFEFLDKREINAMYTDGALYISNIQDDESDLRDDIVHEIAHAVEEKYGQFLYSDEKIKDEFLLKRSRLKRILLFQEYDITDLNFFETEYDENFDNFLNKEVGYDKLGQLAIGVFVSPYAATSIREYWGTGFQEYIFGDRNDIKETSPALYDTLEFLFVEAYEGV